jgi:Arc/MetJ-type ribon-helix-helix transcriptional regulator
MSTVKIAIMLDEEILGRLDDLVREGVFPSRSSVVQTAVGEKLERMERGRLARGCAKLDPSEEQVLAEEGSPVELSAWLEY